jgi:hypothetical protein
MMLNSWGKPMHYDQYGNPVTLQQWRELFEAIDRTVGTTEMKYRGEDVVISTVWLGLNHNFMNPEGPPLIFETMVWGGPMDGSVRHYSTWVEALAGHRRTVRGHRMRLLRFRRAWRTALSIVPTIRLGLRRPGSAKWISIFMWFWIPLWLMGLATVLGNLFIGHNWPLLPIHMATLIVDSLLLKWTVEGYRFKRAQQKTERERIRQENEFQRMMDKEFREN